MSSPRSMRGGRSGLTSVIAACSTTAAAAARGTSSPRGRTKNGQKRVDALVVASGLDRAASWSRCSSQLRATVTGRSRSRGDVGEVQRPLLGREVLADQGEDRTVQDRGLDQRRRVDPDDRVRVEERVEVVGALLPSSVGASGCARPDDGSPGLVRRALPADAVLWVRAQDHCRLGSPGWPRTR